MKKEIEHYAFEAFIAGDIKKIRSINNDLCLMFYLCPELEGGVYGMINSVIEGELAKEYQHKLKHAIKLKVTVSIENFKFSSDPNLLCSSETSEAIVTKGYLIHELEILDKRKDFYEAVN